MEFIKVNLSKTNPQEESETENESDENLKENDQTETEKEKIEILKEEEIIKKDVKVTKKGTKKQQFEDPVVLGISVLLIFVLVLVAILFAFCIPTGLRLFQIANNPLTAPQDVAPDNSLGYAMIIVSSLALTVTVVAVSWAIATYKKRNPQFSVKIQNKQETAEEIGI